MRVTIQHREETSGLTGKHKDCYVDCKVEFGEEERAIIKARDLDTDGFTIRASTPLPTKTQFLSTNLMRVIGRFAIIGGVVYMIYSSFAHPATEPLGGLLFVIGIGVEIYGWMRARKEDKRFESSEQQVTIKQLLTNPTFTVHAGNPAAAKAIEQDIREELTAMKRVIQNSAELQATQTFEL